MEPEVIKTNKYNKFKLHFKNRKLNLSKVKNLAEAISKNNLLPYFPIVVNKQFEILDGQHRFEAAKSVKADLYYIVSGNNYSIENVADSNNFQSHWKQDDYINYYALDGKEPYIKLLELQKKYAITASFIANLHQLANVTKEIKQGTFEFKNYHQTVEILKQARGIGVEYNFKHWNQRPFLRALGYVLKVQGFNKLRMMQKLTTHKELLVKCYTAEDYTRVLETIYNYNSKEVLRFL